MGKHEKLLLQILRGGADANVRFSDLCAMYKYELTIYWSAEDGVYVVNAPELPGCMAHGNTPAEVVANAQDAIALWIDTAKEFGHPAPEPKGRRLIYA